MKFLQLKAAICWAIALLCLSPILHTATTSSLRLAAQKKVLKNGLAVILNQDDSSATTALQILIKGGLRAEPAEKRGLAFLTVRLAVESPDSSKMSELMSMASQISVTVRRDYALINVGCLSLNFEKTLKILASILRNPLFSGLRIDSLKTFMGHQSQLEGDDSLIAGNLASMEAFFGRLAGSIYGDEASLLAIKGKDVSDFYHRYFVASNMLISAVSDLHEDELLRLLEKSFSELPPGNPVFLDSIKPRTPLESQATIERKTKQTYLSLAFPLPRITAKNFALGVLLEHLLGRGPGSRLWNLRRQKNLAYNVNCRVTQMLEGGVLEAYLETDSQKKQSAFSALKEALSEVYKNALTEEELEATKSIVKTSFLRDHETKLAKAAALASFEALDLGFEYFFSFLSEIESLSLEEMKGYIQNVLDPGKAFSLAIGPQADGEKTG